jgi:hypothetical protein
MELWSKAATYDADAALRRAAGGSVTVGPGIRG